MKLIRNTLAVIACSLVCAAAWAQAYPSRPVRLVVPFPPGGTLDIAARAIAPALSEILGQTVVVDNKAGATGIIGTDLVAKAKPDGYTLLMASNSSPAVVAALNPATPFDPSRDFAPVSLVSSTPFVLVVHPSVPAHNVQELIALGKAKPGQLTMASGGVGHLVGELFQSITGAKFLHVPFQGAGPARVALMGGHVDLMFEQLATSVDTTRSGRTRALAVTSASRDPLLPEVPTAAEAGVPDYVVESITGVLAPAGTPAGIIERLNKAIGEALALPATRERFASASLIVTPSTAAQFDDYIRHDFARWKKVVKDANIKP
ncbi:MAG: Bug family tripartite tricarboxylate transporter substrate binding protein [Lautropia sp.]